MKKVLSALVAVSFASIASANGFPAGAHSYAPYNAKKEVRQEHSKPWDITKITPPIVHHPIAVPPIVVPPIAAPPTGVIFTAPPISPPPIVHLPIASPPVQGGVVTISVSAPPIVAP